MRALGAEGGPRLALRTPEHVALQFELAPLGSRIIAVSLDILLVFLSVVLITALTSALAGDSDPFAPIDADDPSLVVEAVALLAGFFLWNFYFIFLELRWQGRTIGKRAVGIRVIARDGGPLSSGMVFARNLTRDVEMLLPLMALANPRAVGLESGWALALMWIWLGIMALMPLFNRLRGRVGDLIAGTLVVNAPREALLEDLVAEGKGGDHAAEGGLAFTQEQLDLYGIHELQILEDVLRRYPAHIDYDLLVTIARKIKRKIDWHAPTGEEPEAYAFLQAFYAAQRGRLEHKLLFGKRQERKVR
ncbi:MAG: RDD family protein [Deltaproteobacteria bacterium]|nr:MAG: RDD family protein [Deltaproteobacteria bacterium]